MYGLHHATIANGKGIVQEGIEYLIHKMTNINATFVEYYDSKWRDLQSDDGIFHNKFIDKFRKTSIRMVSDINTIIENGIQKRRTGATNQNAHSSRSHALLMISSPDLDSTLLFIDMAGNESSGGKENIKETCFINTSLAELNKILVSKAKKTTPVYRGNDFTLFLQPYLVKNKAIVFYHVKPSNIAKNLLTIQEMITVKQEQNKALPAKRNILI